MTPSILGTFASPSIEFSMAIRIFRLISLILTGLFNVTGFIIGYSFMIITILTTKSFGNIHYTWPLIPFNFKSFTNILIRKPIIEIKRNKNS